MIISAIILQREPQICADERRPDPRSSAKSAALTGDLLAWLVHRINDPFTCMRAPDDISKPGIIDLQSVTHKVSAPRINRCVIYHRLSATSEIIVDCDLDCFGVRCLFMRYCATIRSHDR